MNLEEQGILVTPDTSIREAIRIIDSAALGIVLVTDGERRLSGTVTDGDVRRGILRGLSLEEPVQKVMNRDPVTVTMRERTDVLNIMKSRRIHQLPVLDDQGRLVDLVVLDDLLRSNRLENLVVLMAGGLGKRLRPLTAERPKPMLPVGGRPVLETIVRNFVDCNFYRFCFCVNYRSDMIEDYFGDGSRFGARIEYVREDTPMGTAGALTLLPRIPGETFLVMNGDVLTTVDFRNFLQFHREQGVRASMCVRQYDIQVPYGVVRIRGNDILGIDEKPRHEFFVNAGIYALEPSVLNLLPSDQPGDMPSVFESLMAVGERTAAFPLREYWIDIGQMRDLERAEGDFEGTFKS